MIKAIREALEIDKILSLLEPAGDCGRSAKNRPKTWKIGEEKALREEFIRLEILISRLKKDAKLVNCLADCLSQIPYIPHTLAGIEERALTLTEFFEIKKFIHYYLQLEDLCAKSQQPRLYSFADLSGIYRLLDADNQRTPAFTLSPAFNKKLAQVLDNMQNLQQQKRLLESKLSAAAAKAIGLAKIPLELVVSRQDKTLVSKISASEYFLLTAENYANLTFRLKETPELAEVKQKIQQTGIQLEKEEQKVQEALTIKLRAKAKALQQALQLVCKIDWDLAKARFALRYHCCIPQINSNPVLRADGAVNLPVKLRMDSYGIEFQPVDLEFGQTLNVIVGPNMGGKTTAMKTVGQICRLTELAIPVPAVNAVVPLFDAIWLNQCEAGEENLSSFGKEIVSLSEALDRKGRKLLLIDELAKGTNPQEGEAILSAVLETSGQTDGLIIAATHFDKPAQLKQAAHYAIKGIDKKKLEKFTGNKPQELSQKLEMINRMMDYGLLKLSKKQKPPRSALYIADILGLSPEILATAKKYLSENQE